MINNPFRIDKLHKCNGMLNMLIICERYYYLLLLLTTFNIIQ